ncbi:putative late blight resistance protein homolog R1B-16 [Salvia hispanica]|uniref:putative late blight resistance protein homolog R1B-16 n=1 Tax=Salvia hispanica TaxID=49212 RepID=UPI002009B8B5|nr:putative late blight resistance protein homolog R1B-16 [Salvia hispanica]XP_047952655.1 putative late blight resistance protein homolog R1B-16 [Salvia hispanica]
MAAYAALTSLLHILDDIKHHPSPPISIHQQQFESITQTVTSLQEFLETYNSPFANTNEADPLEIRIAEAAYAAQDVIESHIMDMIKLRKSSGAYHGQIHSGGETSSMQSKPLMWFNYFGFLMKPIYHGRKISYIDNLCLKKVIKDMDLVKKEAMKISVSKAQLQRSVSTSGGSSRSSIMVGFGDASREIMDKLTNGVDDRRLQVIPIVGMGGIGKTTLAKHVYAHPYIKEHFDIRAWVTISQSFDTREILCELLSQANKKSKEEMSGMSENEVGLALHKYLFNRRFIIVMDDMWSVDAWDKMQNFFPDNWNGSRIVVTTRQSQLSSQLNKNYCLRLKLLDEVSSWDLFSNSVFGEESCPLELEDIGKKIVENCRGLPLAIVVVGGLLKKMEHTKECWESIRTNSSSVVNSADEDFCLKILKLSYSHLPVYLKPCFIYMGVFDEDRAVRVSTLVKLWDSEGFLRPQSGKSLETSAKEYLNELVDRNLILVHELGSTGNIKRCKVHDLLRDLCCREAGKQGFYYVTGKHESQALNRQRCVVIPRGTSKDEVRDALQSMPLARTLLCHCDEVVPMPESRLLRTLKAFDTDRSGSHNYLFDDLFQFVNSRYLAVGVQRVSEIPSSITFLWNLQTLIIFHSTMVDASYISGMTQLKHIEFHKGDIFMKHPPAFPWVVMNNLQTLKGVALNFPVKYIPYIKKLTGTNFALGNLMYMVKLESCRCYEPNWSLDTIFPRCLKKLSLGSHTSSWVLTGLNLEKIGALPLLQKLKLERAGFENGVWETSEEQFPSLKYLELKWCRLVSWITDSSHIPCLEKLRLYAIKELKEIPCEIGEIPTMQSIHLEYCSKSVVESAKAIAEEQDEIQVRAVLFNNSNNQALRWSLAGPNF